MSENVLRPILYQQLQRRFGKVKVANRGIEMLAAYEKLPDGRLTLDLDKRKGYYPGEHYRVCCRYCQDTKFRLYVNHRWGLYDDKTKSRNLWLAHCMNDNCIDDLDRRQELYVDVLGSIGVRSDDIVVRGERLSAEAGEVEWPGRVHRLDQMHPDSAPCTYLRGRNFDPAFLGARLGVSYLVEAKPRYRYCEGRIIIPVYFGDKLLGWQARFVGEARDMPEGAAKYYSAAGMSRSCVLYNFDNARQYKYVVVLEGPAKVWRFGPEAVATLGKEVTGFQAELLARHWELVIVMLDPDAAAENEDLFEQLKERGQKVVRVSLEGLPAPDDMATHEARRLAFEAVAAAGYQLPK